MDLTKLGIDFKRVDPLRLAYIHSYYARKREQDEKAQAASNRWETRKARLVERCHATPGWETDSQKFRDVCDKDNALNDALQAWSFHERESKRCQGVIETELLMEAVRQATPRRPSPGPAPTQRDPLAYIQNPGARAARGRRV